jgi:hypothetical protein
MVIEPFEKQLFTMFYLTNFCRLTAGGFAATHFKIRFIGPN